MSLISLTDEQNRALKLAKEWWFREDLKPFVILGIAGSGKSTIVQYLVEEIGLNEDHVAFCTLTGKAASVLQRKGNSSAQTIHSLIYDFSENPKTHEVVFTKKNDIGDNIKLIVVDEFMMVNKEIMNDIISFKKKMILIGDPYQLKPPFGESNGLDKEYDVLLDEPMRQSLDSPIIWLANRAKNKMFIKYGDYGNCKVISKRQIDLEEFKNADQIIACKNNTVKSLNKFFRKKILNKTSLYPEKGEKLMCLKNNNGLTTFEEKFSATLTNGLTVFLEKDIDEIASVAASIVDVRPEYFKNHCFQNIYLDLLFFKYNYNKYDELYNSEYKDLYQGILKSRKNFGINDNGIEIKINPFTYGYVCTCHKYQGSEAENIFYIHEFMGKQIDANLLYTGITRASKKIIIVK